LPHYEHQRAKDYLTQELKQLLNKNKNDCIQTFLPGLTLITLTDYSLRKRTKKIKQVKKSSPPLRTSQGTWARCNVEEAQTFAEHVANVFGRIPRKMNLKRKKHFYNFSRPPTNSKHQSTASKELKFKKSSTA
jgi:hypothetical protein